MNCIKSLIPYLALIFLITMITCCAQTPAIFITLRSVKEDERPIAMGMQYLLLRLLAYIPVRKLLKHVLRNTAYITYITLFSLHRVQPIFYMV